MCIFGNTYLLDIYTLKVILDHLIGLKEVFSPDLALHPRIKLIKLDYLILNFASL